jgi:hypothetical protein
MCISEVKKKGDCGCWQDGNRNSAEEGAGTASCAALYYYKPEAFLLFHALLVS